MFSSGQKAGLWFENYCEIYCWYQITSQMLLKFRMLVHNIASGSKICIKCVQCMHRNRKKIKTSNPVSLTAAKFYQHTVHLSYQTMVLEITKCIFLIGKVEMAFCIFAIWQSDLSQLFSHWGTCLSRPNWSFVWKVSTSHLLEKKSFFDDNDDFCYIKKV